MPDQPEKHKPTIDQRLEAIAMHLEILASMQQASDQRIGKLSDKVDKMADSINTLGRIAGLHEQRLDEAEMSLDQIIARLERLERDRKRPQA